MRRAGTQGLGGFSVPGSALICRRGNSKRFQPGVHSPQGLRARTGEVCVSEYGVRVFGRWV